MLVIRNRRYTIAPLMLVASVACSGCGWLGGQTPDRSSATESGTSPVELHQVGAHPRLGLVARQGDPEAGIAFAMTHDGGSRVSIALGDLLARRFEKARVAVEVVPHELGLAARGLARDTAEARRWVHVFTEALRTPVPAAEGPGASRLSSRSVLQAWETPVDEAIGDCSGELGAAQGSAPITPSVLEEWRERVYSTGATAAAAVGPRSILDEVAGALNSTPDWPTSSDVDDPWPEADVFGVAPARLARSNVSVALRVGDTPRVLGSARVLAMPTSSLAARTRGLEPAWTVERVVGIARPRGACLRIDLRPETTEPVAIAEAAGVAQLALDEAEAALSRSARSAFELDAGIFAANDPRDAAAIAAWRALTGSLEPGPLRRFVRLELPRAEAHREASQAFANALARTREAWSKPSVKVLHRLEVGQGELWLLLATPCGTASENADDAGLLALAMRALALKSPKIHGVRLEPWITPDGVGLLAHAPPRSASETPRALAHRVGTALGRALGGTHLSGDDAAAARALIQSELGPERGALWDVAFQALSPDHPSFLDARGTWQAVTQHSTHAADLERLAFVRGPLRLAVLANADASQVSIAAGALERWLRPTRKTSGKCAAVPTPTPRLGEYSVETDDAPDQGGRALVAVSFMPSPLRGIPHEAEWSLYLLNRPGGWLDRALKRPGLATQAHATLLGGRTAGAFVFEIATLEGNVAEAVAQVRALLGRLSAGAATEADLTIARRTFELVERRAELNPRHRMVELWRADPDTKWPDLASLRQFHKNAFAVNRHVVVVEKPRP